MESKEQLAQAPRGDCHQGDRRKRNPFEVALAVGETWVAIRPFEFDGTTLGRKPASARTKPRIISTSAIERHAILTRGHIVGIEVLDRLSRPAAARSFFDSSRLCS